MYNKYEKVNWEDYPSTKTPVNAKNLGIMDQGIYDLDRYVDNTIGGLAYESMLGKNFDDFRGGGENLIRNGWCSFEAYGNEGEEERAPIDIFNDGYTRNLIIGGGEEVTSGEYLVSKYDLEGNIEGNVYYTISLEVNISESSGRHALLLYDSGPSILWKEIPIGKIDKGKWVRIKSTFPTTKTVVGEHLRIYHGPASEEGNIKIRNVKLERGSNTDPVWTPSWKELPNSIKPVRVWDNMVISKENVGNGTTRIRTEGGDVPTKLIRGFSTKYNTFSVYLENNGEGTVFVLQNRGWVEERVRPGEGKYIKLTSKDDVSTANQVHIRTPIPHDMDITVSSPHMSAGGRAGNIVFIETTGKVKYGYRIKFYGEGEEVLTYTGDSVIEKGKEYSYVLSLKNTAEDLRLRDNLSGRTIKIKQGEQLIEYTGVAQKTEKVDFTLLSKDKDLELEINPPRMVQGSYVTLEPIRDSYNTVVERSNKLEEELGQHRFKELPNLIPDGWNSFEPYGSTENLLEDGWDGFSPYGSGKNYVDNWDFSTDEMLWTGSSLKATLEDGKLKMVNHTDRVNTMAYYTIRMEGTDLIDVVLRVKYRSTHGFNFDNFEGGGHADTTLFEPSDEFVVREVTGKITDGTRVKMYNGGIRNGKLGMITEVDWIQITPINDQHLAVEISPAGKGITRVRTWGGNQKFGWRLRALVPTLEDRMYSFDITNVGNNIRIADSWSASNEKIIKTGYQGNIKGRIDDRSGTLFIANATTSHKSLDFYVSPPVVNVGDTPSIEIYKEDLSNGLTEIRTWGGTGNTKLWYKSDSVSGELTNSIYVKNKGDVPVGIHGFGEKYDYVQPGEERVVTQTTSGGSPMLQILGGDGNLHFIAGPPKIVEGKESQPPFSPEQILGQVAGPRGYLDLLRRVEELERIIKGNAITLEAEIIEEE